MKHRNVYINKVYILIYTDSKHTYCLHATFSNFWFETIKSGLLVAKKKTHIIEIAKSNLQVLLGQETIPIPIPLCIPPPTSKRPWAWTMLCRYLSLLLLLLLRQNLLCLIVCCLLLARAWFLYLTDSSWERKTERVREWENESCNSSILLPFRFNCIHCTLTLIYIVIISCE